VTTLLDSETANGAPVGLVEAAVPLLACWRWVIGLPLAVATVAVCTTYVVAPTYTARTTLLPPQQQQSSAASALASLNSLSGLTVPAVRTSADQYAALLRSNAVVDPIIASFDLKTVYGKDLLSDARRALLDKVQIGVGKKDGIISIDVDDQSPQRAAEIANRFVEELRNVTARLALTEAQQRRQFFEGQLRQNRERLTAAQRALQASGFDAGALRAEPKAAAETYARLRADVTATEVRLQALRQSLADTAPEVQALQAALAALRSRLTAVEATSDIAAGPDYVSKYREYKYEETLFEIFSRQYELARLDEAKEGNAMQVIDAATPPERRSRPRRAQTAINALLATFALMVVFLEGRHFWGLWSRRPQNGGQVDRLRKAWRGHHA
jgi:uncharacterized protein involved in exopolysaccharide biosynthesis